MPSRSTPERKMVSGGFATTESGVATSSSDLTFRGDPEEDRGDAAEDHGTRSDDVAGEQRVAVRSVADQVAVPVRAERAEELRDREEQGDGLRPDLEREDLARGQVTGAGARGREEEHDRPADRLGRRVSCLSRCCPP
jgi:hypothetical protein